MREVGAFEAKTHLSELLKQVATGARITITHRGKPVARLVPVEEVSESSRADLLDRMAGLRARISRRFGAFSTEELSSTRDEGRR